MARNNSGETPAKADIVSVRLAHFMTYQGREYVPGDVVDADPETAANWSRAGYALLEPTPAAAPEAPAPDSSV